MVKYIVINKYKYTEKEIKEIFSSIVIIVDSREKVNNHVIEYFNEKKINWEVKTLSSGDYSFYVKMNEKLSIPRDIYYTDQITIERKANIDELIGNFANDRNRIEDEFLRYKGNMTLLIEEGDYSDIRAGKYTSKYNAKSAIGTLHSFSIKYGVPFIFLNKEDTGCFIYCSFYYYLRSIIT